MRKLRLNLAMILMSIIIIFTSGCVITIQPSNIESENQTLTFVEAKFVEWFDDKERIGLFFDYTNNSEESKSPSDGFVMGVRQNGELLDTLWVAEKINGAITPSTIVEPGVTMRVAWLFVLRDRSPLSVIVSDGQKFTVDYEQIVS